MSKTRPAYFCYTCSEEVTFRGTRIRYNLDGSLHLCNADDKVAYEKYRKYTYDNTGWRLTGEDFWKWKRDIYDVQRWTQSRDFYNELKEQRERDQQRAAEVEAEQRRKTAEAEAQRRKAAEEEQRREEQRKQTSKEKRRAARQRRKQREQAEAEAAAKEAEARERERQAKGRPRRRSSRSRSHEPGRLDMEALKIMGLTVDILRLSSKEAVTVIKNRFRPLAMKFHPDRGGDANNFMAMNEAYEYLLRVHSAA
jgi:chemotaxis protein histidine kinase CheA